MKKIFTILTLALIAFSGKMVAQSNVTWAFTDGGDKQFFKSHTEFNITVSGINDAQAAEMQAKIKSNKDVASCTPLVKNAAGTYNMTMKMVKAHDGDYFINWAEKMGVKSFQLNGKTKSLAELNAKRAGAKK